MELYIGAPEVDVNHLFNILQKTSGVYLTISNQSKASADGFDIKSGVCTSLKLTKSIVEKLPQPYSECTDLKDSKSEMVKILKDNNYTYTQKSCLVILFCSIIGRIFIRIIIFFVLNRKFAIKSTS